MDKLTTGLSVTVIGMGIVFAVLILLWGVLELMRIIFNPSSEKKNVKTADAPTPIAEKSDDDEELVAVITAAIAAFLGTSENKLKIASIKRTENNSPVWNRISRQQIMNKSL